MSIRFLRMLESVLWIAGLVCVAAYAYSRMQVARAQTAAVASLEARWSKGEPDQALWSERRSRLYADAQNRSDDVTALGILSIPGVGIDVAVFDGTSEDVLNSGAGRVPGTAPFGGDGNLAIAAHRDGFFRPLKDINIDDRIFIRSATGTREYKVAETLIVNPDYVSVLEPTEAPTITLITCYPFNFVGNAPQRFIVRAKLAASDTVSQSKEL